MVKKGTKVSNRKIKQENEKVIEKLMADNAESDSTNEDTEDEMELSEDEDNQTGHKQALCKLQKSDPDFYKFLKDNDKELLKFSGSEDEYSDEETENTKKEKYHKAPGKLEVASDDSEASDDEEVVESSRVTVAKINKWKQQLENKPTISLLREVVAAFASAVTQASGSDVPEDEKLHVRGGSVFNALMKVCMTDFQPALHKVMKLPLSSQRKDIDPQKAKLWLKLKKTIQTYLTNLIQVVSVVSDPSVSEIVLKHVHQMIPFILAIPKITKQALKLFIKFWCMAEETLRILSFLSIMAICRRQPHNYLDLVLKQMYMSYVKNCKFTSPSTWPLINFMKHSLAEVYSLDEVVAYQHAFVYIRQLAIHLRNAIALKKKDSVQSVYNWQYIHSALLWSHLLGHLSNSEVMKPLIYPLVQVITGTIKLVSTQRYLPLRFHLISALTLISDKTDTFIPVLPFITEVLDMMDLNKKHTNVSFKPMDFSCSLRLSKKQLSENGFKDRAVDQVYETMIDYLHSQSNKIGYPELILPTVVKLKSFIKNCKIANYNKQLKQLMDKVIENGVHVTEKRKSFSSNISDSTAADAWERQLKDEGTPLIKYYTTWRKMKNIEKASSIAKKKDVGEPKLPDIPKHKKTLKAKQNGKRKSGELFSESEGESDVDIAEYLVPSAKKPKAHNNRH